MYVHMYVCTYVCVCVCVCVMKSHMEEWIYLMNKYETIQLIKKGAAQLHVKVKKTIAIWNTDGLVSPITVTAIVVIATNT